MGGGPAGAAIGFVIGTALNLAISGITYLLSDDTEAELEEITEPVVKRGQIWKLGNHYLMCGDSTSKEDIEKLLSAGEKTDE